ncbi:MAG: UDP-N-acetylglucosamine 1-carboxyvinyltransferase [Bdellovibrio sp.]|nr:UDP-N-acetylglucosamine 1-carboxyvinyltransferase [Bdellovibrio sp.]
MDKIKIIGGKPLNGKVEVSGAKNAALPILISSLLADGPCRFSRVPRLQDIRTTLKLLGHLGVSVNAHLDQNQVELHADHIHTLDAPYDLVKTMRASVVVLGPLLARFGRAKVSLPGGCAIGARPIGFHLAGLEKLGAEIQLEGGYVIASAKRLRGNRVAFEFPSVGATENLLMASVLAEGETILENCAKEPEVVDLAKTLKAMGAQIEGEGTETIHVQGKTSLVGCDHEIMGDRIEAGTFLAAGFASGGNVRVDGLNPDYIESLLVKFEEAGAKITRGDGFIGLQSLGRPKAVDMTTQPYPGFPTDMQAQFMAVMAVAEGASLISETIFENRFMHVSELARLGADIAIRGNTAIVKGQKSLRGAPIMATDLRASASLIIAGLCAQGETVIDRIYHLDRGYERVEEKIQQLGGSIERVR